jgi:hypothetical protein
MVIGFGRRPHVPLLRRRWQRIAIYTLTCSVTLIYFVHYHITIVCINTKHREVKHKEWDTEDTQTHGPAEGPSAPCRHGKDQVGVMVEELVGATMDPIMER